MAQAYEFTKMNSAKDLKQLFEHPAAQEAPEGIFLIHPQHLTPKAKTSPDW